MLDIKTLNKAIEQLASEKDLDPNLILEAVEAALASAYKKEYNKKGEVVRCVLSTKTGDAEFSQIKTVVDETSVRFDDQTQVDADGKPIESDGDKEKNSNKSEPNPSKSELDQYKSESEEGDVLPLYNPDRHILLDEAIKIKKDTQLGDEITFELPDPESDFGRIAAQTAKQVILQKLREIEKDSVKKEFESKSGELVTGTVQRVERGNVFVDLGKASGIMFFSEAIPGEHYRIGERLKFYLLSVQEQGRGPNLVLSRSHPKFVSKLFELEVPEIADGIVQVKGIVREPGSRTKIAVTSTADGVDPVGACVGQRGARVMAVNNELGSEKIDIIEWSDNAEKFVSSAISPASASSVEIISNREALVLVPDDQLSLAIGRGGQNVRLAAKLTGWKIDVRSQSNPETVLEGGIAEEVVVKKEEDEE